MSRGQESSAGTTAQGQNATYYNNAQNSYANAQADVGDYEKQLGDYGASVAKFTSSNPYVEGGEYQTSQNKSLANTADATARAAGQTLQGQALRTGQNTAGDIAATEKMEQQNTRDLSADQAKANDQRISSEAGYNQQGVNMEGELTKAAEAPAQLESTLSGQQGSLGNQSLEDEINAYAKNPSFGDEFGGMFAQQLGKEAAGMI